MMLPNATSGYNNFMPSVPRRSSHPITYSQFGVGVYQHAICLARVLKAVNSPPILDTCRYQIFPRLVTANYFKELAPHQFSQRRTPCVSVMTPGYYSLISLKVPAVASADLPSIVRWKVQELVDFHAEDAIIDIIELPFVEGCDYKTAYVAVAKKEIVQSQVDTLLQAGFKLKSLLIPELAIRNLASLLPVDQQGAIFLWFTHNRCILTINYKNHLYLAKTLEYEVDRLLDLMVIGKLSRYEKIAQQPQILALLETFAQEIQQMIETYQLQFNRSPIKNLILAPLPYETALAEYFEKDKGFNVTTVDLNKLFISQHLITLDEQAHCLPMLGAALPVEGIQLHETFLT